MAEWEEGFSEPPTIVIRGGGGDWEEKFAAREAETLDLSWKRQTDILEGIQQADTWNKEDTSRMLEEEDNLQRSALEREMMDLSKQQQDEYWQELGAAREEQANAQRALIEGQLMEKSRKRDDALWSSLMSAREKQKGIVSKVRQSRAVYDLERELLSHKSLEQMAARNRSKQLPELIRERSRLLQKLRKLNPQRAEEIQSEWKN